MPELAEVEVARRNVAGWWQGRRASEVRLLDEKVLKTGDEKTLSAALTSRLTEITRRGKYLFFHFESGQVLVAHFRMTGKFVVADIPEPSYARLSVLVDQTGWIVFKDQRRFGEVHVFPEEELPDYAPLKAMGPEPEDLSWEDLKSRCSKRRMLKSALLDQSVVAGVGNIAISELYFRLGLSPTVRGGDLDDAQWQALTAAMPPYFDELIERSLSEEIIYLGEADAENIFDVYGRENEPCPRCETPIERVKVTGRSSFFCPNCQPG